MREGVRRKMANEIFTPMEIDAIGEIMNISLGSSATAVSNLLDHRVDITTPTVRIVNAEDFTLGQLNPAIGVEIRYVAGLDGSNIMLLKMSDVKLIVDLLMGMETPDEEFELNDLTLSAVCEVMNQMMGSSSTALSDFLGRVVNISTPVTFNCDDMDQMRAEHLPVQQGPIVVVSFALSIEGSMSSEFMNVMSVELAKEMVSGFGLGEGEDSSGVLEAEIEDDSGGRPMSQAEIEAMMAAANGAPAPAPEPAGGGGVMSQDQIEAMMAGMAGGGAAPAPAPEPASSGGKMSQDEIEKLMAGMAGGGAAPAPEPASSGGKMSQDEIEKLMAGMAGGGAAPAPEPASSGGKMSQDEIEKLMSGMAGGGAAPAPTPPPAPAPAPAQQAAPGYYGMPPGWMEMQQQMQQQMQMQMQQMQQQMAAMQQQNMQQMQAMQQAMQQTAAAVAKPDPKVVSAKAPTMPTLADGTKLTKDETQNLDLIMGVSLEIAVEIGRTRKRVQDILALSKGSLVVLDKLAGDQVDVYVNGKCIAHGDVVVIDDNFGIRISEIVQKPSLDTLN